MNFNTIYLSNLHIKIKLFRYFLLVYEKLYFKSNFYSYLQLISGMTYKIKCICQEFFLNWIFLALEDAFGTNRFTSFAVSQSLCVFDTPQFYHPQNKTIKLSFELRYGTVR